MWKQGSLLGSHCTATAKETTRQFLQTFQGKFYSKLKKEHHSHHRSLPCGFQNRLRAVYFHRDFSLVWLSTLCCQNTGIKHQKGHTRSEHSWERYLTFHLRLESKTSACVVQEWFERVQSQIVISLLLLFASLSLSFSSQKCPCRMVFLWKMWFDRTETQHGDVFV